MNGNRQQRPHVKPTTQTYPRRVTTIREASGRHAAEVSQTTGGGYLTDMQGFALPLIFVMIVLMVTVFKIFLPDPFPTPLAVIGLLAAIGALGSGVFLSYLGLRSAQTVDYIDVSRLKRTSMFLHIVEAVLIVVWLNWLIETIAVTGAISGPIFLIALIMIIALRIRRGRLTRRRQLWER